MLQEQVGEARSIRVGGKGYAGRWLLELWVQPQRVSRDGDLAVRGYTGPSKDEEQEKLKELWLPFGGRTNSPTYISIFWGCY